MKKIAVIPARWQSSRFPGKPLALLNEKSLIQHVYERVRASGIFNEVIVATDDEKILETVHSFGGKAEMTSNAHQSGTDRIAEVCSRHNYDIVVNVQGDEPLITSAPLIKLVASFHDPSVMVSSLMHKIKDRISDPNQVKVVCDSSGDALYFSRAAIPHDREQSGGFDYWGHIGVYAFRKEILEQFVAMPPSSLEKIEKLEQLRLLENGIKIRMVSTEYYGIGVDTPQDLKLAESLMIK